MAALTDETIMAYADGALPADEARAVEVALAADPALAARAEMFRRSRERTREALAPLAAEPVPDALTARVIAAAIASADTGHDVDSDGGTVVAFRPRSRQRWLPAGSWSTLAASLALAVGVGAGYTIGSSDGPDGAVRTPPLGSSALAAALSTVPAGAETAVDGDRFRAIASFRVDGGGLCREFEVDYADRSSVVAVACRSEGAASDGAWAVTFSVASAATAEGYAPVSSMEALEAYLTAVGAAPPLEPAEEQAALAQR